MLNRVLLYTNGARIIFIWSKCVTPRASRQSWTNRHTFASSLSLDTALATSAAILFPSSDWMPTLCLGSIISEDWPCVSLCLCFSPVWKCCSGPTTRRIYSCGCCSCCLRRTGTAKWMPLRRHWTGWRFSWQLTVSFGWRVEREGSRPLPACVDFVCSSALA